MSSDFDPSQMPAGIMGSLKKALGGKEPSVNIEYIEQKPKSKYDDERQLKKYRDLRRKKKKAKHRAQRKGRS